MSEPESPEQGAAFRALPAMQDHARNRVDLHRAIDEYQSTAKLHQQIVTMIVERYTDYLPELPHEQIKQKLTGDVLLVQNVQDLLTQCAQNLVDLARKLEGYIPSGDIAA